MKTNKEISEKESKGVSFDFEENEKWLASLPTLEKLLKDEKIQIKTSKKQLVFELFSIYHDLLNLAGNVDKISNSLLRQNILEIAGKTLMSCNLPEFIMNDLASRALPLASYGKKTKLERRQGGANSHEMKEIDRIERNNQLQEDIDRLCVGKKHFYRSACAILASKYSLSLKTIQRNTKNPLS